MSNDSEPFVYKGGRIPSHIRQSVQRVVVDPSITEIDDHALEGCSALKEIKFHNGVTSIGASALADCIVLEHLSLPSSLRTLGVEALTCTALVHLTIPEGVTAIPDGLCADDEDLVTVNLPATLQSIGTRAFDGCTNLLAITIPPLVHSIPSFCFRDCEKLSAAFLPLGLERVGRNAFKGCKALTTIGLPDGIGLDAEQQISADEDNFFGQEYHPLYLCQTLQHVAQGSQNRKLAEMPLWDYAQHCLEEYPMHQACYWSQTDGAKMAAAVKDCWRITSEWVNIDQVDDGKRTVLHLLALNPAVVAGVSTTGETAFDVVLNAAAKVLAKGNNGSAMADFVMAPDKQGRSALQLAIKCQPPSGNSTLEALVRALAKHKDDLLKDSWSIIVGMVPAALRDQLRL